MQTSQQLVSSFYLAYYGRPADVNGLAYWTQQLDKSGGNLSDIVDAFANSAESTANFGGLTAPQHISLLYQQLLSRSPEQAGAAYWLGEVNAGRITLAKMAISLYEGALGSDTTTVQVRQQVADQFTAALPANGTGYNGLAAVEAARMVVQAANANTSAADITGLAQAGVTLAANTSANPSILTALMGANGSLMDLLATPVGTANPVALVNLVNTIVATAAGNSASLTTLLGTQTLTEVITNLPAGVTLTSLETAIDTGGFNGGSVVINPTTPDDGGGPTGPAAPTFVATEANGVITFSGTATGDITIVDNHMSSTFMRGGITAEGEFSLGNPSKITLAADQKISATADAVKADALSGLTIDGAGSVAITELQLYSDLSKITTTVTAAVTTVTGNPVQLNSYANLGKAVVTVSGNGVFDLSIGAVGTASFIVEAGATLKGSGIPSSSGPNLVDQLSGATITGTGKVDITGVQAGTDFSGFAPGLTVKATLEAGTFSVSDAAALAVDEFAVGTGVELQLTAEQAVGKLINGAGKMTVSGSDGNQTLNVTTTGTNTIAGGKGGDAITLDIGLFTFPGTDKIVVKGAASGIPGVTESTTLGFADLAEGQSATVDGLMLTATSSITGADVAAGFANLLASATTGNTVTGGTWSGQLSAAWSSDQASGSTVKFTSTTADTDVDNLTASVSQGTPEVQTIEIANAALVAGSIYTLAIGSTKLTTAALGENPDIAALVSAIQAASGYVNAGFTVAADNGKLKLAWATNGNVANEATLTANTLDTSTADTATAIEGMMGTAKTQTFMIGSGDLDDVAYTLSIGQTLLTTAALGTSPTIATLVNAIKADTGYAGAAFTVAAEGGNLKLTWKAVGAVVEDASLSDGGLAQVSSTSTDGTSGTAGTTETQTIAIANAALVAGSVYTLAIGTTTLTTAALGANPDIAALVSAIQAASGYGNAGFTVAADGNNLKLVWTAGGEVEGNATLTASALGEIDIATLHEQREGTDTVTESVALRIDPANIIAGAVYALKVGSTTLTTSPLVEIISHGRPVLDIGTLINALRDAAGYNNVDFTLDNPYGTDGYVTFSIRWKATGDVVDTVTLTKSSLIPGTPDTATVVIEGSAGTGTVETQTISALTNAPLTEGDSYTLTVGATTLTTAALDGASITTLVDALKAAPGYAAAAFNVDVDVVTPPGGLKLTWKTVGNVTEVAQITKTGLTPGGADTATAVHGSGPATALTTSDPTPGKAAVAPGTESDSYWSEAGGTYDIITGFGVGQLAMQKDKLQLDVADVFANGSYTVGAITVSVSNGMATVSSASGVGDALSAIATAMGTAKTTAAYVVGNDTYILQNDGVAGLSNADVVIKLVGTSTLNSVTNLADILAPI